MSRGDSFTDGKSVTISGTINEKNFDHVVGLALHEGSHIVYSDFDLFASVSKHDKLRNWDLTSDRMEFFRNMINYIEDRRIDNIVFKSSPGYKGYYHTLYSKFFNHKTIGKGLRSKEYRGMTSSLTCSESLTSLILIPCWMLFQDSEISIVSLT